MYVMYIYNIYIYNILVKIYYCLAYDVSVYAVVFCFWHEHHKD